MHPTPDRPDPQPQAPPTFHIGPLYRQVSRRSRQLCRNVRSASHRYWNRVTKLPGAGAPQGGLTVLPTEYPLVRAVAPLVKNLHAQHVSESRGSVWW